MRAASTAICIALTLLLTACPPPTASCYLIVTGAPRKSGRVLFNAVSAEVARQLHSRVTERRDGKIWLSEELITRGVDDVSLYLHRATNGIFIHISDSGSGGRLSQSGRDIIARARLALEKAAAPASVRETARYEDVIALVGEHDFLLRGQ